MVHPKSTAPAVGFMTVANWPKWCLGRGWPQMSGARRLVSRRRFGVGVGIGVRVRQLDLVFGHHLLRFDTEEVFHALPQVIHHVLEISNAMFHLRLPRLEVLASFISSIECLSSVIPLEFSPSRERICPNCSFGVTIDIYLWVQYK